MKKQELLKKELYEELCEEIGVEELKELVYECNCWDSSLEDYEAYEHDDDFYDTYFIKPSDVVNCIIFGDVKYIDEYIKFDAYGNLKTLPTWEYEELLESGKEEIIDRALELYEENKLCLSNEIECLFDQYLTSLDELEELDE